MAKAANKPFEFKDADVAAKFVPGPELVSANQDFRIRVPQANWPKNGDPGYFSTISVEAAEQLIREGYNHIVSKL